MSTKTVKLNASLHEELKAISEKDGLVLQDLIEEKLTEVLEEKGVYSFDASDITFDSKEQIFNLKLSPSNLHALTVMIKRLCLNEKINNLNQMDNLMTAIKALEATYEQHKKEINKVDDFFRAGHKAILNAINGLNTEITEKAAEAESEERRKAVEAELNAQLEAIAPSPKLEDTISEESQAILDIFENVEKTVESRTNAFRQKMIISEFKDKIFKVRKRLLKDSNIDINNLQDYHKFSDKFYFLFVNSSSFEEYAYFAGDKFEILNYLRADIDMEDVTKVSYYDVIDIASINL
jgi:hypothetical protein